MITAWRLENGGLARTEALEEAVWIDLLAPDDAERGRLSAILGAETPSRAEQEEIEGSSRLYIEPGAAVMTALLPAYSQTEAPELGPVTFMLGRERMATVRHQTPRPFETYPSRAARAPIPCASAPTVLLGLLEEVIDRLADITEHLARQIDGLADETFEAEDAAGGDLRASLKKIGRLERRVAELRDSLVSMERMLGFLVAVLDNQKAGKDAKALLKTQIRDVRTILEQAGRLTQKTGFLLEATLGLINVEQNAIIKIFSVVAVVFLPPTLVASIYGMNFRAMPELGWSFGYPAALGLMAVSAAVPLIYFKRKGWF